MIYVTLYKYFGVRKVALNLMYRLFNHRLCEVLSLILLIKI